MRIPDVIREPEIAQPRQPEIMTPRDPEPERREEPHAPDRSPERVIEPKH
ncbi:hypothetical protein H1R82_04810 [Thermoactinomyces intermedius]|jgi:hypothetical protein|uniref:Uncharacterized protein n=1 Tax=Thermoactinomyces intermedius TaxID=2024 RepID=A0A8I1AD25_THEIN|nr:MULTISPECIES: hypothetical protein [Thermoactinomyces]MBA4547931.1 hypothetical protein [Thermoactinomyces intermedius]MBA4835957.1 hypothetical protein [Thermoactinomyces intermedius]MBH8593838.1 hypothetical protein [Thermoactinomyces intermedius]MBH8599885.1 hypothetical protein [Thermoactinomyces sp. CICC 23799]